MAELKVITLTNSNGMAFRLTNFGATIMGLEVPNKHNELTNVVVGLNDAVDYTYQSYFDKSLSLGSSIGRYAGRISNGGFTIHEVFYPLHNENGVHLHGGRRGFDKVYWNVEELIETATPSVTFSYLSPHLEEGYPGNLQVFVTYKLTENNTLKISHKATTDRATYVNLTNHSYFNLDGSGSILDHELMIHSNGHLDVDENLIPTGKILDSKGTRFDRNSKSVIGRADFKGYDDTFILNEGQLKVTLLSRKSGIKMNVYTNQPACVVFTKPKFPELPFRKGSNFSEYPSICFETQNFPDAPNHPHFPSSILYPEETYLNESVFEFSLVGD